MTRSIRYLIWTWVCLLRSGNTIKTRWNTNFHRQIKNKKLKRKNKGYVEQKTVWLVLQKGKFETLGAYWLRKSLIYFQVAKNKNKKAWARPLRSSTKSPPSACATHRRKPPHTQPPEKPDPKLTEQTTLYAAEPHRNAPDEDGTTPTQWRRRNLSGTKRSHQRLHLVFQ